MAGFATGRDDRVTDIGQLIDAGAWSGIQKLAVFVAAFAIVLDGFANQVLALSIPMLMKAWHVSRDDFQWVQVVGYAGMALGTGSRDRRRLGAWRRQSPAASASRARSIIRIWRSTSNRSAW